MTTVTRSEGQPVTDRPLFAGPRIGPPTPRVALLLLAAVVVAGILYLARDALPPFIVGLLLVYILDPPVDWLSRRRVPRPLAIVLVYALAVLLVVGGVNLIVAAVVDQVRAFVDDLPGLIRQLDVQLQRLSEIYRAMVLPRELREAIDRALADVGSGVARIDLLGLVRPIFSSVWGLGTAVIAYLIIPVWVFYLLKDRRALASSFDRSLPAEWRDDVLAMTRIAGYVFGRWVRGQIFLGLAVGLATWAGLLVLAATVDPIFGRYSVLLAVSAGVLELLPIIGPIIAAVPAVLLAATVGLVPALAALGLYTLIQQLENYVLVPKIQGDAVRLHPAAVIFALIVGGSIAGLLGAILALPLTAVGRDLYRYLFHRLGPAAPAAEEALAAALGHPVAPVTAPAAAPLAGDAPSAEPDPGRPSP